MNKVVFSRWDAPFYCDIEYILDNGDRVILKYKQMKNMPDVFKSAEGNEYSIIAEGEQVLGFQMIRPGG